MRSDVADENPSIYWVLLLFWISLDFLELVDGGGCSLGRTTLRDYFLVTGEKYREFSRFWCNCFDGEWSYPAVFWIFTAL